jgi:hypothetical protein
MLIICPPVAGFGYRVAFHHADGFCNLTTSSREPINPFDL